MPEVTLPSVPAHGPWVTDWLGQPRFARYVTEAHGDNQRALELYEWNAAVSANFMHDLAHLEVAVRNAYNRALDTRPGAAGHWVSDSTVFPPVWRTKRRTDPRTGKRSTIQVDINEQPRKSLARAVRDAGGLSASPGKVVAQLSFGFWRYLSSTAHDATLWRDCLYRAFPPGTARIEVDTRMGGLHELRNRVAHHEPLLAFGLDQNRENLFDLATLVNPVLRTHLEATSSVSALLAARP